jgi:hypothetical protein
VQRCAGESQLPRTSFALQTGSASVNTQPLADIQNITLAQRLSEQGQQITFDGLVLS